MTPRPLTTTCALLLAAPTAGAQPFGFEPGDAFVLVGSQNSPGLEIVLIGGDGTAVHVEPELLDYGSGDLESVSLLGDDGAVMLNVTGAVQGQQLELQDTLNNEQMGIWGTTGTQLTGGAGMGAPSAGFMPPSIYGFKPNLIGLTTGWSWLFPRQSAVRNGFPSQTLYLPGLDIAFDNPLIAADGRNLLQGGAGADMIPFEILPQQITNAVHPETALLALDGVLRTCIVFFDAGDGVSIPSLYAMEEEEPQAFPTDVASRTRLIAEGGLMTDPRAVASGHNPTEIVLFVLDGDAGGGRGAAPVPGVIAVDQQGNQTLVTAGGLLADPTDLAVAPDGSLLITDAAIGGQGALIRVDPEDGSQTVAHVFTGDRTGPVAVSAVHRDVTTFTVNVLFDSADPNPGDGLVGDGVEMSLRAAIMEANATPNPSGVVIDLPAGTHTLSRPVAGSGPDTDGRGDLDIRGFVRIRGQGAGVTEIDADRLSRVFEIHDGATLVLSDLTIRGGNALAAEGGTGGGLMVAGDASLFNCLMLANTASGDGAGVAVGPTGFARLVETEFNQNLAGGSGGGLAIVRGDAEVRRSLFVENRCVRDGGGIFNSGGAITITNSTLTFNTAGRSGGGLTNEEDGEAALGRCTVSDNSADLDGAGGRGGGLANLGGTVQIQGVVIADNTGPDPDTTGTLASLGFNLIETVGGATITGATATNLVGVDPLLGPLDDNGGPTRTRSLQPESPAVDLGGPALPTDQRRLPRTIDGDGDGLAETDAGAWESQTTPCLADLDGSGVLDLTDVTLFVGAFLDQDTLADLNGDGVFDLADVSAFVAAFVAGCP